MDCSPSASSVHGILQARILEWLASAGKKIKSTLKKKKKDALLRLTNHTFHWIKSIFFLLIRTKSLGPDNNSKCLYLRCLDPLQLGGPRPKTLYLLTMMAFVKKARELLTFSQLSWRRKTWHWFSDICDSFKELLTQNFRGKWPCNNISSENSAIWF